MTIEEALKERLATVLPAVPAYPKARPASATAADLPAIEYTVEELDCPAELDGGDGTAAATATIRVLARSLAECESHADTIRAALPAQGADWSGLAVDAAWCESESDSAVAPPPEGGDWTYEIEATYRVLYRP